MSDSDGTALPVSRFLLSSACLIIIIAGLQAATPILVPFLLSAFLSILCAPPLMWLESKRVPAALGVAIVLLGVLLIGLLITAFVGSSLAEFRHNLPFYQQQLAATTLDLAAWLNAKGVHISTEIMADALDPGAAMRMAGSLLSGLGGVLTNAFLIFLTVVFILFEAVSLPDKLRGALGGQGSLRHLERFMASVKRYLAIKTIVSLATGIVIAVWLAILGVDFPVLWGLLAFLLNFVPNIGSIIAAVPAVLLAFIELGTGTALLTTLGYVVVNIIVGNVIEPRFMGKGLGLSTLVVFLSLVLWGWVLGPVGMLLSVPLTMIVKIGLEAREDTRWIAVLLDSGADNALPTEESNPNYS
ncbi:MAG: AI-2E family transporter [Mariprofundaceae bacterium]